MAKCLHQFPHARFQRVDRVDAPTGSWNISYGVAVAKPLDAQDNDAFSGVLGKR